MGALQSFGGAMTWLMHRLMFATVALLGLGLSGYTLVCAFGYAPWLEMTATFGGVAYSQAGWLVQVAATALLLGLCFFLPANARIMTLENSHRRFHIAMEDVARAYRLCHASDREGVFKMRSEFDSVRERMAYLHDHPDLAELEPSVLEVASQMSHLSRDLARTYSESSVARARDFLVQRQQEIEEFNTRLDAAKATASEMRVWADKVALEESVAQAQLARLNAELADILPELHKGTDTPTIPHDRVPQQVPHRNRRPKTATIRTTSPTRTTTALSPCSRVGPPNDTVLTDIACRPARLGSQAPPWRNPPQTSCVSPAATRPPSGRAAAMPAKRGIRSSRKRHWPPAPRPERWALRKAGPCR